MKRHDSPQEISLTVNGEQRIVWLRPGDTLLRTLREGLGLTGTKNGCENGDCGACTVLIDGEPRKSCMELTHLVGDRSVTTIEGLSDSPVQRGFVEEYGFQCGFCTSGQIMAATALLAAHPDPDGETTREWMEGNLCRCTGYEGIERAIRCAIREGGTA